MKTNKFPLGTSLIEKIKSLYWKLRGCDHNGSFCLDIGEPGEYEYWYCFRCNTKL